MADEDEVAQEDQVGQVRAVVGQRGLLGRLAQDRTARSTTAMTCCTRSSWLRNRGTVA